MRIRFIKNEKGSAISFREKMVSLGFWIYDLLPFGNLWAIKKMMDKDSFSVLDVGCGKAYPLEATNMAHKFFTVGIDIFLPYLKQCKLKKIYDDVVLCDIRFLPFAEKSFDVVLVLSVIEHLEKDAGSMCLGNLENVACKQIVLLTPVKYFFHGEKDGNPYQKHQSLWMPKEMRERGYEVRGIDHRWLSGNGLLKYFTHIVSFVAFPLRFIPYLFPNQALAMICIKRMKYKSEDF